MLKKKNDDEMMIKNIIIIMMRCVVYYYHHIIIIIVLIEGRTRKTNSTNTGDTVITFSQMHKSKSTDCEASGRDAAN